MEQPKKILVRGPNWLGDQVMASSAFRLLRDSYPQSELTLLSPDGVSSLNFGLFDNVWSVPRASLKGAAVRALSRLMKLKGFDASLSFPSSYSASLAPWFAGIAIRVGFAEGASGIFLSSAIAWRGRSSGKHKARLYLDLVEHFSGNHVEQKAILHPGTGTGPIVVAPGASIELRVWPYFFELIQWLCTQFPDRKITVVGSKLEHRWTHALSPIQSPNFSNQIEKTSVEELVKICRDASLVIANDSGVAHVAGSLAGAPTLVLFGPGDPRYVRPIGPRVQLLRKDLSCSPCESATCRSPFGYQRCLRILTLGDVQAAVRTALQTSRNL